MLHELICLAKEISAAINRGFLFPDKQTKTSKPLNGLDQQRGTTTISKYKLQAATQWLLQSSGEQIDK